MIFESKPTDFVPEIVVVASYVINQGKILLLQRLPHKTHGGHWGLPAGKINSGEEPLTAIAREVYEETGLMLPLDSFTQHGELWVENEGHHIHYHTFSTILYAEQEITLSTDEHGDFAWVHPEETLNVQLVHDLHECNQIYFPKLGL